MDDVKGREADQIAKLEEKLEELMRELVSIDGEQL